LQGFTATTMEHNRFQVVDECIRDAAQQVAVTDGLSAPIIERFLRSGEETWEGAGSGRFSLAQFKEDEAYTRATKTAMRTLLHHLESCFRQKPNWPRRWPLRQFGCELSRW
jgi:hypothetical protein